MASRIEHADGVCYRYARIPRDSRELEESGPCDLPEDHTSGLHRHPDGWWWRWLDGTGYERVSVSSVPQKPNAQRRYQSHVNDLGQTVHTRWRVWCDGRPITKSFGDLAEAEDFFDKTETAQRLDREETTILRTRDV